MSTSLTSARPQKFSDVKFSSDPSHHDTDLSLCILHDLTVVSCGWSWDPKIAAGWSVHASVGKQLHVGNGASRKQLEKAIALLMQSPALGSVFVQLDDRERNRSRYLAISMLPAGFADGLTGNGSGQTCFLVILRDLTSDVKLSPEALMESLDLTPMEAKLCIALLNERSLQDFATDHGLTIATARWHWGNVRQKLNVRTQLGLVRMLMRLAHP